MPHRHNQVKGIIKKSSKNVMFNEMNLQRDPRRNILLPTMCGCTCLAFARSTHCVTG